MDIPRTILSISSGRDQLPRRVDLEFYLLWNEEEDKSLKSIEIRSSLFISSLVVLDTKAYRSQGSPIDHTCDESLHELVEADDGPRSSSSSTTQSSNHNGSFHDQTMQASQHGDVMDLSDDHQNTSLHETRDSSATTSHNEDATRIPIGDLDPNPLVTLQRRYLSDIGAWTEKTPQTDHPTGLPATRSRSGSPPSRTDQREPIPTIMCPYHTLMFENLENWSQPSPPQNAHPLSRFMADYSSSRAELYLRLYTESSSSSTTCCCWAGIHADLSE